MCVLSITSLYEVERAVEGAVEKAVELSYEYTSLPRALRQREDRVFSNHSQRQWSLHM